MDKIATLKNAIYALYRDYRNIDLQGICLTGKELTKYIENRKEEIGLSIGTLEEELLALEIKNE